MQSLDDLRRIIRRIETRQPPRTAREPIERIVGGEVVDARQTAPGETRGNSIRGGETRELRAGDVIAIPRGVPHWFKSVTTPFRYYVVKSISGE